MSEERYTINQTGKVSLLSVDNYIKALQEAEQKVWTDWKSYHEGNIGYDKYAKVYFNEGKYTLVPPASGRVVGKMIHSGFIKPPVKASQDTEKTQKPTNMYTDAINFALDTNTNLLATGKHGVGKTKILRSILQKRGIPHIYFSASLIDPWVHFIGIPKEVNGKLEFIQPKHFEWGETQAIVIDELNRAHHTIHSGLMEIIEDKSINGQKIPNLKVVFGLINPADDQDYVVDKLDEALRDRFDLQVNVTPSIDVDYFKNNLFNGDERKTDRLNAWYRAHFASKGAPYISPRRIDKAVRCFNLGGDPSWVLPANGTNIEGFIKAISADSTVEVETDLLDTIEKLEQEDFERNRTKIEGLINTSIDNQEVWQAVIQQSHNIKLSALCFSNEFFTSKFTFDRLNREQSKKDNADRAKRIVSAIWDNGNRSYSWELTLKCLATKNVTIMFSFASTTISHSTLLGTCGRAILDKTARNSEGKILIDIPYRSRYTSDQIEELREVGFIPRIF